MECNTTLTISELKELNFSVKSNSTLIKPNRTLTMNVRQKRIGNFVKKRHVKLRSNHACGDHEGLKIDLSIQICTDYILQEINCFVFSLPFLNY